MPCNFPVIDVDPRDPSFYQNPYAFYARWHAEHPRFFWSTYDRVCFASFSDVDGILRDRRFGRVFSESESTCPVSRDHLQNFDSLEEYSLLNVEPPQHTQLRKLVNRAFVSSKIEYLRPQILEIANDLINQLQHKAECDLLQDYLMPLPALVIARLIGMPEQAVPRLLDWSHAMVKVYTLTQSRADEQAADSASREFKEYLQQLIDTRRKAPTDDLLGHLLGVQSEGGGLSDDQIISTVVLLLNAGHEATVHQSGNAVKSICEQGLDIEQLFADENSTAAFTEEILRFDAPLHIFMRYALQEVDMGGGLILQPGQEVALLFGAANRDPLRFAQPDQLLAGRTDAGHVSFGAGIHFCLGAPLARMEMQLSLPLLFQRLPKLHLLESPRYADSYHFHGLESLRVGAS